MVPRLGQLLSQADIEPCGLSVHCWIGVARIVRLCGARWQDGLAPESSVGCLTSASFVRRLHEEEKQVAAEQKRQAKDAEEQRAQEAAAKLPTVSERFPASYPLCISTKM
jgi:hypothetical protein